ncbi:hypothetical protein MRX96_004282 [Rhipicephalus microplus]
MVVKGRLNLRIIPARKPKSVVIGKRRELYEPGAGAFPGLASGGMSGGSCLKVREERSNMVGERPGKEVCATWAHAQSGSSDAANKKRALLEKGAAPVSGTRDCGGDHTGAKNLLPGLARKSFFFGGTRRRVLALVLDRGRLYRRSRLGRFVLTRRKTFVLTRRKSECSWSATV